MLEDIKIKSLGKREFVVLAGIVVSWKYSHMKKLCKLEGMYILKIVQYFIFLNG